MRKSLILLVILLALPVAAQWRRANLFGADIRALIVDPASPDTVYVGTSGGEVYVSSDGAHTWRNPRGSVPFPGYVVDNLVIDRTGRLWAACWGVWGGGAIAVSPDGGATWERRDGGLEDESIRAIAVSIGRANSSARRFVQAIAARVARSTLRTARRAAASIVQRKPRSESRCTGRQLRPNPPIWSPTSWLICAASI